VVVRRWQLWQPILAVIIPNGSGTGQRRDLGDTVELQANTVATVLAQHLHASYKQLYVPDSVSQEVLRQHPGKEDERRALL
jgi:hypothetical protein